MNNIARDIIMVLMIFLPIMVSFADESIRQENFMETQKSAYETIYMINERKFDELQTMEDAEQKIEVRQSLTFPADKQLQIKRNSDNNFRSPITYYIENHYGIATVVAAKYRGANILTDYETYQKELEHTSSSLPKLIDRINTEKFDNLESIFNPEYLGVCSDFEYEITIYPSIQYPWDKQIKIRSKSMSGENVILYMENNNGRAKMIDIKQQ